MPTVKLTVPKGAWTREEKAVLVERLTDAVAGYAAEQGKGDIKAFVNVHIVEPAEGGYAVGGQIVG